jgi:hypothetical protein
VCYKLEKEKLAGERRLGEATPTCSDGSTEGAVSYELGSGEEEKFSLRRGAWRIRAVHGWHVAIQRGGRWHTVRTLSARSELSRHDQSGCTRSASSSKRPDSSMHGVGGVLPVGRAEPVKHFHSKDFPNMKLIPTCKI